MTDVDDYCCSIDRHLHELLDDAKEQREITEQQEETYQAPQLYYVVHVGDAEKISESGSSFIAYTISFGDYEVKRRYSEFESLRSCLCRLYPTFIVPPIPEKHSLAQYAVLQKRAKEDQYIIERRKRMLEHFLNHLAEHPILSSEHIFHRFLESGVSWTEVLHSPVITGLPKTPLHSSPSRAPGSSIADGMGAQLPKIAATNSFASDVPIPSTLAPIKNIEARWMDCELFTNKYANHFSGTIEKNERRIYRKLGELSSDYAELGATLNGFSLLDHPEMLAAAIERAGQAIDSSYIEIGELLTQMEAEVGEPIHEYAQYAAIIKQVLRFRLLKNLQLENVEEGLVRQRAKLERLLQADDEAKRLAHALEGGQASGAQNNAPPVRNRRRLNSTADTADEESLQSDAMQGQGFVTPQRANTDASSMHGGAGTGRSRGPSVSSAVSSGFHSEFTPTLAPRSIREDTDASRSPSLQPSLPNTHGIHPRARPRSGTATSAALDVHADEDDPLAQFQQEESQMWGGGAGSTLPRLGARSRGRAKSAAANGRRDSQADGSDVASSFGAHAHLAQSEYIGQASNRNAIDENRHSQAFDASAAKMAASTPALWDQSHTEQAAIDGTEADQNFSQQHLISSGNAVGSSSSMLTKPAATSGGSSFGVRLLRSPKTLGDGIMNRLTYALNGMMDVDPEQMRHNQIGRASDKISLLEEQLEMLSNDMALINTSTQDNLDRFQKHKVRDLKGVLISMAKMHLEWAEKNLEIWQDAKVAVDEV
ncbi:Sorting nexin, cytoplasm-to-vacuole targeting pathway/endosomal sorting [Coemansia sp. RSA 989]|nr:Sorting nexin, cytoplasm-to-vacuole targeting pathway/endosomal sorting [Coemansia sp. RSA 1821]KAJ1860954.1 Sorting nexin, cytoplasm-to-vacuole targeting pathway/endosomal sorting [Coemansia sp. RSA 989]KAJ2667674.1 Sorting nexin, cytoplasm-to-vacuole targeting pathway/endosomal sorting [Coemansia sp. RSA 1085]